MTPESTKLVRELIEKEIFNLHERRSELRRQAETADEPEAFYGEATRLEGKIVALRALEKEFVAGQQDIFA